MKFQLKKAKQTKQQQGGRKDRLLTLGCSSLNATSPVTPLISSSGRAVLSTTLSLT